MKWIHKPPYGTTRIKKMFAFLPVYCNNGDAAWLETIYVKQKYYTTGEWINLSLATVKEYEDDVEKLNGN